MFHKESCTALVRKVFTDAYGRKITIMGKWAFEYSVYIEHIDSTVERISFENGRLAREFAETLKKR